VVTTASTRSSPDIGEALAPFVDRGTVACETPDETKDTRSGDGRRALK
jgi:hypothetical protein